MTSNRPRRRVRDAVSAAVVAGVVVSTVACTAQSTPDPGSRSQTSSQSVKSGSHQVRTDLAPLQSRFPMLGSALSAQWSSGTLGDGRVPGPSTYWIDAVVTMSPADVDRIVQRYSPVTRGRVPDVASELQSAVPAGPFLESDAVNRDFVGPGWRADVFVVPERNVLVVVAKGTD